MTVKSLDWKRKFEMNQDVATYSDVVFNTMLIGDTTNGITLDATNGIRYHGNTTTFSDIQVPLSAATVVTNPQPTFSLFRSSIYAYAFSGNLVNTVAFTTQLPHAYKEGSTLFPHLHCAFDAVPTIGQTVALQFSYTLTNIGDIIQAGTVQPTITYTISASDVQYKHFMLSLAPISGTGILISALMNGVLSRLGNTDTSNADLFIFEFDLHYEIDSLGSNTTDVK